MILTKLEETPEKKKKIYIALTLKTDTEVNVLRTQHSVKILYQFNSEEKNPALTIALTSEQWWKVLFMKHL